MPEVLWKAYIDFETLEGEREKARALYERLIALSGHVKVWIAYAMFEAEAIPIARAQRDEEGDDDDEVPMVDGDADLARQVFGRGYRDLKSKGLKSEVCVIAICYKPNCSLIWFHSGLPFLKFGSHSKKRTVLQKMCRRWKE